MWNTRFPALFLELFTNFTGPAFPGSSASEPAVSSVNIPALSGSARLTRTGTVKADLDILQRLPFPFKRAGQDNATIWNVTLPSTSEVVFNYTAASSSSGKVVSISSSQRELNSIAKAAFLAYDQDWYDAVKDGKVERVFGGGDWHEAPVYIPEKKWIWFCGIEGDNQYIVDLDSMTVSNFTSDPPVQNVNGGTYHNRKIIASTNGGPDAAAALYEIDVETNKSSVIFNNYQGIAFNSPNDVIYDSSGNLWFTDPLYGSFNHMNPRTPQLLTAVYFYNSTSKIVSVAADGLVQPNGLVLSPDEETMYIGDTGAAGPAETQKAIGPRVVYAFDVVKGRFLTNRRTFHLSTTGFPDGMRVATNGDLWVVSGSNRGLEVINPLGQLIGQVLLPEVQGQGSEQTTQVFNLVFVPTANGWDDVWAVGGDSLWRVSGIEVKGKTIG